MLGRPVGSALRRFPIYARLPLRPSPFQFPADLRSRTLLLSLQRSYATRGKPKKAIGEPSRPVKRSVKRAAKSPATGEAGRQVRAKKNAAATKPKKVAAKKPTPKRAKRELTPEQLEAKKVKTEKAKISALKKAALDPPMNRAVSAYVMFVKEKTAKTEGEAKLESQAATERMRSAARDWKALSPAEHEHYNHLAVRDTEERREAYKRYVESHTPEQIHGANNARSQLRRRKLAKPRSSTWSPIQDDRAVKRPASAYIQFTINRHASGDFKNIPLAERARLMAQEWKALAESEKKKYKDLQTQETSRYVDEYKDLYGSMPPSMNHGAQAQAAAGAA